MTTTVSGYGTDVHVTAPAASDTVTFTEFQKWRMQFQPLGLGNLPPGFVGTTTTTVP